MKSIKNLKELSYEEVIKIVDDFAYGKDSDDVYDFLKASGASYCDEGIDDGGDEDDEYIMYCSYQLGRIWIKLYYSSLDNIVNYIEYRNN